MHITLILIAFLVCTVSCSAQEEPLSCLELEDGGKHDFGEITHSDKPSHRFVLRNVCSDTVRITHVKAACGCTTASLAGGTVAPGGTAAVDVTFYPPRSTNGRIRKSVAVWVQGGRQQQYLLRVEADIRSNFRTVPEKVELGTIRKGATSESTIRLTNTSDKTHEITEILSGFSIESRGDSGEAPPRVLPVTEAEFTPRQFTLAPGDTREITVRITPQHTGRLMGSMIIYAGPENRQVEFTATIETAK